MASAPGPTSPRKRRKWLRRIVVALLLVLTVGAPAY